MNKAKSAVVVVVLMLISAAGGFYGGMTYQKAQVPSFAQGGGPFGMAGGLAGQANGRQRGAFAQNGQGRPVSGEIVEQDDNSITVKMPDGSSKIVMLSSNTQISKPSSGTKSDLKKGERITAMGEENSDGTFIAESVILGRFGFQGHNAGGNASNSTNGGH